MKLLLLIFTFNICSAQYKWTDYDTHYHVSGSIAACTGAAMYIATKKPVLSTFLGCLTAFSIGMVKEYYYDKKLGKGYFSDRDIEANLKGSLFYSMYTAISIHELEKKQLTDSLKYQNLNIK